MCWRPTSLAVVDVLPSRERGPYRASELDLAIGLAQHWQIRAQHPDRFPRPLRQSLRSREFLRTASSSLILRASSTPDMPPGMMTSLKTRWTARRPADASSAAARVAGLETVAEILQAQFAVSCARRDCPRRAISSPPRQAPRRRPGASICGRAAASRPSSFGK